MRTIVLGLVCLAFSSGTAAAQAPCSVGGDILQVADWSIEPIDDSTNSLSVTLKNTGTNNIRMVDGSVGFVDALGGQIASYKIDRDASIGAGEEYSHTGRWGPFTFERLLKLRPEEIGTWVCVRSVLYEDGTIERFNQ